MHSTSLQAWICPPWGLYPLIRGHVDMEIPENPGTKDKYLAWDALGIGSCVEPHSQYQALKYKRLHMGRFLQFISCSGCHSGCGTKVCGLCQCTHAVWPCL